MLCGAVSLAVSIAAPIGVVAMFGEEFRPAYNDRDDPGVVKWRSGWGPSWWRTPSAATVDRCLRASATCSIWSVGWPWFPQPIAFAGLTGAALGVAVSCCGTAAVALILLRRVSRARVSSL